MPHDPKVRAARRPPSLNDPDRVASRINNMSEKLIGRWTAEEFFAGMRPPTADDVPIALDGTRLDTRKKVLAYLHEINARREAEQRVARGA